MFVLSLDQLLHFLFANISNIFHAPSEVIEVIESFDAISQPKQNQRIEKKVVKEIEESLNEKDEVKIDDEYIIGKSVDCFGEKIYKMLLTKTI